MPVAIVSDSTCDLTPAQAAGMGVDLVPIFVQFGGQRYRDGVDITVTEFYKKLDPNGELPTTAPPSQESFEAAFDKHVRAGKDVVCPTVSSKMSKTFEIATAAAKSFGSSVRVFDTKTLSGGVGLLVSGAARMAAAGMDASAIVSALTKWSSTQRGFAVYPDLKFMAKSGRINKAQLVLGTVMHVFPVTRVTPEGAMEGETTVKSWEQAKEMLASIASRKLERPANSRVFITHANAPADAEFIASELRKKLIAAPKELSIYTAGATIGANVGPGSLGIFMIEDTQ
ncbi:MAG TPA: DegV family protein [Candidatus Baltobacteraceae bacterium]|nr:DegV family protein [Candidatus Baltobacteraceae bacterium]